MPTSTQIRKPLRQTKGSRRNKFAFCCRPPGPLARRERRCVPGAVREERATKPAGLWTQPEGARSSAYLASRNRLMIDHRQSRQNVKLFLHERFGSSFCTESQATAGACSNLDWINPIMEKAISSIETESVFHVTS